MASDGLIALAIASGPVLVRPVSAEAGVETDDADLLVLDKLYRHEAGAGLRALLSVGASTPSARRASR